MKELSSHREKETEQKARFRPLIRALLRPFPNKLVAALSDEWEAKKTQHLRSRLKHLGTDTGMEPTISIFSPERVEIGDRCQINSYVTILGSGNVTLGNGVWVASHAILVSHSHPSDVEFVGDHPPLEAPIVVEDNVWIGSHAVILPGVRLGRSSIVAAGCVVTKDVPPYAIVAGVPGKVMRYKDIPAATESAHEQIIVPAQ